MCSLHSAIVVLVVATTIASAADAAAPRYGFGKPASKEEIAGWDIDVRPDGAGLPPGRGSVAQGQVIYDAQCASCHGTFGESNDYLALAGGVGTLASGQPIRTTGSKLNFATTLWDYINRAMPFQSPKTLKPDEVYALTAYVLNLNDIVPADAALDQVSILAVRMPNRDGFTSAHGLGSRAGTPDTKNVACMQDCGPSPKLSSQIPEHARDAHGNLADQMRDLRAQRPLTVVASAKPREPAELAKSAGCLACHGVVNRIVGPGLQEIRARYGRQSGAEAKLAARVKQGSSGTWGSVPMPAHRELGDADIRTLIRWILAGTP